MWIEKKKSGFMNDEIKTRKKEERKILCKQLRLLLDYHSKLSLTGPWLDEEQSLPGRDCSYPIMDPWVTILNDSLIVALLFT